MRYLGIDFGTKRVGLAYSNEDGTMAFPLAVVPNDEHLLKTVVGHIEDKGVAEVVIGKSVGKGGEANKVQEAIDAFMLDLTLELGLPIHQEPEQYTTQAAIREQGRTEMTDASAAALILDSYLARVKNA